MTKALPHLAKMALVYAGAALIVSCSGQGSQVSSGQKEAASAGSTPTCTAPAPLPAPLRSTLITPGMDYCSLLKAASAGDEFVFASGTYSNPCHFTGSGTAKAPIVLRSADPSVTGRAKFTYSGTPVNFFEIEGHFVVLKDLAFENNSADRVIRLYNNQGVVIEGNTFRGIVQAITANSGNTSHLMIRGNDFANVTATVIYLGCQAGDCQSTDLLLEGNTIDASMINDTSITGYGVEIKLNSYGTIRDNSIFNAQGPDLMVYGNQNPSAPPNIIDGNYFETSRNDASLNIGGGPARVFNNVLINQSGKAVYAQDYAGRGLQRGVSIFNNTIISSSGTGISVQNWSSASQNNSIQGNAIRAAIPLSPANPVANMSNNVSCGTSDCFLGSSSASPFLLAPSSTGKLAATISGFTAPAYDFFGMARTPNQAGAIVSSDQTRGTSLATKQARPARVQFCHD